MLGIVGHVQNIDIKDICGFAGMSAQRRIISFHYVIAPENGVCKMVTLTLKTLWFILFVPLSPIKMRNKILLY